MKLLIAIVGFLALFINNVNGYAVAVSPACTGLAICSSIEGDAATANFDADGNVTSCKFGQTAFDEELRNENGFCEPSCDEDEEFACACISEEVRAVGLAFEASLLQLLSYLTLVLFFAVVTVWGCCEFFKRKARKEHEENVLVAKGDMDKVITEDPGQLRCRCCYPLISIIILVVSIVYFVQTAEIMNSDYWSGCGTSEAGFFQEV